MMKLNLSKQEASHRESGWQFCLQWLSATFIAGAIGWPLVSLIGLATSGYGLYLTAGFVMGAIVGIAQQRVLRKSNHSRGWILANTLGGGFAWVLTIFTFFLITAVVELEGYVLAWIGGLAGGALHGLTQWLSLYFRDVRKAIVYVIASALGWANGWLIGMLIGGVLFERLATAEYKTQKLQPVLHFESPDFVAFVGGGTIGTLVFGLITGAAMAWILKQDRVLREVQSTYSHAAHANEGLDRRDL